MLAQYLANGLASGCLYGIMALGFALIYNTTRVFHVAHGATFTIGAYTVFWAADRLQWPLAAAIALAIGVSALVGIATEAAIYYPLFRKNASLVIILISSLALYTILVNGLALIFGNDSQIMTRGADVSYEIGSAHVTRMQCIDALVFFVLSCLLFGFLRLSIWGRAIRAVRDDPQLAATMGINLRLLRLSVFAVGSGMAGLAGILTTLDVGIDPQVGFQAVLTGSVAVIIGGIGVFSGAVLGSLLLGLLQNFAVWLAGASWETAVTFGLLLLFLLFRPAGLLAGSMRPEEI